MVLRSRNQDARRMSEQGEPGRAAGPCEDILYAQAVCSEPGAVSPNT